MRFPLAVIVQNQPSTKNNNYMKTNILFFLLLCNFFSYGQTPSFYDKFKHFQVFKNKDTINFHIYSKNDLKTVKKILLFVQGSGPQAMYEINEKTDTIKDNSEIGYKLEKSTYITSSNPIRLKTFPNDYALILISKKSFPFERKAGDTLVSKLYYENETLKYRVWQADEVLKHCTKKLFTNLAKIVVLGHSEGTDVVAKLGTINKKITHIGFWSGGANTQFYDFALFDRKETIAGNNTEIEFKNKFENLTATMKNIFDNPNLTDKYWFGCTYKRWSAFSEPSIESLLKIKVPIFVVHGAKDNSVPVESSLLIPIEFIRYKKTNLTYKLYPDLDHNLDIPAKNQNEEPIRKWDEIFEEFIKWCEK